MQAVERSYLIWLVAAPFFVAGLGVFVALGGRKIRELWSVLSGLFLTAWTGYSWWEIAGIVPKSRIYAQEFGLWFSLGEMGVDSALRYDWLSAMVLCITSIVYTLTTLARMQFPDSTDQYQNSSVELLGLGGLYLAFLADNIVLFAVGASLASAAAIVVLWPVLGHKRAVRLMLWDRASEIPLWLILAVMYGIGRMVEFSHAHFMIGVRQIGIPDSIGIALAVPVAAFLFLRIYVTMQSLLLESVRRREPVLVWACFVAAVPVVYLIGRIYFGLIADRGFLSYGMYGSTAILLLVLARLWQKRSLGAGLHAVALSQFAIALQMVSMASFDLFVPYALNLLVALSSAVWSFQLASEQGRNSRLAQLSLFVSFGALLGLPPFAGYQMLAPLLVMGQVLSSSWLPLINIALAQLAVVVVFGRLVSRSRSAAAQPASHGSSPVRALFLLLLIALNIVPSVLAVNPIVGRELNVESLGFSWLMPWFEAMHRKGLLGAYSEFPVEIFAIGTAAYVAVLGVLFLVGSRGSKPERILEPEGGDGMWTKLVVWISQAARTVDKLGFSGIPRLIFWTTESVFESARSFSASTIGGTLLWFLCLLALGWGYLL